MKHLTTDQEEILELVADGMTYGEIADKLKRSRTAVKRMMTRARLALDARTSHHAIALYVGQKNTQEVNEWF